MDQTSQRVVVIGAGVVGVTTAYALARRGFNVTVIERLSGAALETSRANAGQRSYGYVSPWASPHMLKHALPWLLRRDGPLKISLPPSSMTLAFLAHTLGFIATPGLYNANKRAMLDLASYSRTCFLALEEDLPFGFDGDHSGLIDLASDAATFHGLQKTANLLTELGIANRLLPEPKLRELEPGLRGPAPLYGGLQVEGDGTGDCHRFTQSLAEHCVSQGVQFIYGREVCGAQLEGNRIRGLALEPAVAAVSPGIATSNEGKPESAAFIEADQFVLCAGCDSRGLGEILGQRLPIYPVKGYSLTAPLRNPGLGPRSTVIDDRFKVVATRLGQRLRVTGFVELADRNRQIPAGRLSTLRRAIDSRFPGAADLDRAEAWTGFRPMTPDGPPILGHSLRENLFLNTGHGTFGWTLSAACAELSAQCLSGEKPRIDLTAFRPGRY